MVKSITKVGLICLFSLLFVMKSEALFIERMPIGMNWYYDSSNGTYSIVDMTFYDAVELQKGTPYMFYMPQNIAAGQTVYAHFKTRCVGNATYDYTVNADVKDTAGNVVANNSITWKNNAWSGDYAFAIPTTAAGVQFNVPYTKNTKAKQTKFWMPMPVHLDVMDMTAPDVEFGQSSIIYVGLHSFFTEENNRSIHMEIIDDELNAGDFEIVNGTLTPNKRCGHHANFGCNFYNCNNPSNQFQLRFTPSALGDRSVKLRIYNGSQEKIITVTAKSVPSYAHFHAVGDGNIQLYINGSTIPEEGNDVPFITGDTLRFVAVANKGSHFLNWNLNPFHRDTVIEFVAQHSVALVANFQYNMYKVCVIPCDPAQGRVNLITACQHPCKPFRCGFHHHHPRCPQLCADMPYGSKVKLQAVPAPGYIFMGWSGCDDDSIIDYNPVAIVEVGEENSFMANFAKEEEVFHFVAETNKGMNIVYPNEASIPNSNFMYKINDGAWVEYTIGDTITVDNIGDIVYMTAKTTNRRVQCLNNYSEVYTGVVTPAIWVSDTSSVVGNIMYLLDHTGKTTTLPAKAFKGIFASDPILDADKLILPADVMEENAYHSMFHQCTALRSVPALPATKLASQCYSYIFWGCTSLNAFPELKADSIPFKAYESMFRDCSSLTSAPELSALKIDGCAYRSMFNGCVSLEEAPALPATTLAEKCYESMFANCSTLVAGPVLPATVLAENCYKWLFQNCVNLSKIEVKFTDWGDDNRYGTRIWTRGVAQNGIFVCPPELAKIRNTPSMEHNIPALWNINVAVVNYRVNDDDMGHVVAEYTQGNIPIMSGDQIDFGKEVRFTATAEDGYVFDHFEDGEGNFIIAENPFAIVINEDRTIVAVFTEVQAAPGAPVRSENASYIAVAEGMNIVIKGADDAKVCVYDAAGRLVEAIDNAANFETVNVETPGVYFVYVPGQFTTRVIVK